MTWPLMKNVGVPLDADGIAVGLVLQYLALEFL